MAIEPREARRSAVMGVAILVARTVVTQGIALGGTILLLRILTPEDLGTFAVLQFVMTFLQFFGDAGIGGALVQGRDEPSPAALSNVFTVQVALGLLLVGIAWLASPGIRAVWPGLPPSAPTLLRAMALSFLLVGLRGVPSILLERRLRFGALAVSEVAQVATFYLVACVSAFRGLGDWTWPLAVLSQAAVGTLVVLVAQPWRPVFAFDPAIVRPLVRFGIPFQAKNLIGFANGAVTPLYGGAVLGPTAVGLVTWGQQLAHVPLRLVEVVARVTFPLFSRFQHDRDSLGRAVERALQLSAAAVFFAAAIFLTAGSEITRLVFSEKWLPGLVALHAFSAALCIGFVSPVVGSALDALGRPGLMARLAVAWTVVNWIVVPVATRRWGLPGFAIGLCVHVVLGNAAVLWVSRRILPEVSFTRAVRAPAVAGAATALLGWFVLRPWASTMPRLLLGLAVAGTVHAAVLAVLDRQAFRIVRELAAPRQPG